jgi:hypothetical protein
MRNLPEKTCHFFAKTKYRLRGIKDGKSIFLH